MKMRQMDFEEAHKLLKRYGIRAPEYEAVKNKKEAVKAAARMRCPVAMKVVSDKILHKTDAGGVKLNVKKEEVGKAFEGIMKLKGAKAVMMQKMQSGNDVIIGMKRDAQFGPVIAFGLGGIFVEVLKDISFRIAPLSEKDAMEMMAEIKGYPILTGARGSEKANLKLLTSMILAVSRLAVENPNIKEIDLNPVMANSKEAVAVDARLMVE